jgi:hypothetical protein
MKRQKDRPFDVFGFLGFLALLFCFCYFLFAFLPTLIKEEDKMRRKNENRAFKEAPSQTFSLTCA